MRLLNYDHSREKRCGVPEMVYGEGKSAEDLMRIAEKFIQRTGRVIITRISEAKTERVLRSLDAKNLCVKHNKKGQVLIIKKRKAQKKPSGLVGIITAGTSDIPVAEEAKEIAQELGCRVLCEYDVGIAGLHRIFPAMKRMRSADAYIVIAGMEGALPSVVSGLVKAPVIAVPSSVGYGTSGRGRTALNTMLNSCTPLAVVNIDNGYGAAVLAYKILSGRKK